MTTEHQDALFRALRGPGNEPDAMTRRLLDEVVAEECMVIGPIIFDIEQQVRNAERFQCLLELTWALRQAGNLFAEIVN